MSRGLHEITTKWEKGNEAERAVATELRELERKRVAPEEFLPILFHLKNSQMLPNEAVFCIVTDLLERIASAKAIEAIGTWEDCEELLFNARMELSKEIEGVIDSFLSRNPLPPGEVVTVLQTLIDEPTWKETAPKYDQRMHAATLDILPQIFRQHSLSEMAALFEERPEEFKRMKKAGERYLIGQTYIEEAEAACKASLPWAERESS